MITLCSAPFLSHVASVAPSFLLLSLSQAPLLNLRCLDCMCQGTVLLATKLPVEGGKQTIHKFCCLCHFTWFILQGPKEFLQTDLELKDLLISSLTALFQLLIGCIQSLAITLGF